MCPVIFAKKYEWFKLICLRVSRNSCLQIGGRDMGGVVSCVDQKPMLWHLRALWFWQQEYQRRWRQCSRHAPDMRMFVEEYIE